MKSIIKPKILALLSVLCAFVATALSSCMINRNISNDPRLSPLLAKTMVTRVPLRLYEPDYQRTGWDDLYYLTTTNLGGKGLLGVVGTGTEVTFDRAILEKGGGGSWEMLEGHIGYEGVSYPIGYNLGMTVYPDGWRRVYDNFEFKRQNKSEMATPRKPSD